MKHEFWNIPNTVTIARLALLPLVVACHFWEHAWGGFVSAVIFGIAASTDWVDGYLARRLNLTTPFGAFLDPVADKLMVVTALILQVEYMDAWWFTLIAVVITCREVTISALREWMAQIGSRRKVAVQVIGKIKTVFQMVAISFLFLYQSWHFQPLFYLTVLLFLIAVVFTLWSMCIYLVSAWKAINEDDL